MGISGLVVTLDRDKALAEQAIVALADRAGVTVGPRAGDRLPVVVEEDTGRLTQKLHRWVLDLPGVVKASLVYTHDTATASSEGPV